MAKQVPLVENSISPFSIQGDNQLVMAIVLMLIGIASILVLEYFGRHKK